MKIILSRKGFDSSYGGCASPIFEDDSLISLPIPQSPIPPNVCVNYSDIHYDTGNGRKPIAAVVEDLTRGRMNGGVPVHLDPDLRKESLERKPGWRPLFGQSDAAQRHLDNQEVRPGDVFLFFGWFRRVESIDGKFRFKHNSHDLHVIFGWLKVGEIWQRGKDEKWKKENNEIPIPEWADSHPHVMYPFASAITPHTNTIYVAASSDNSYEAGTFHSATKESGLILTNQNQMNRSVWRLPKFFHVGEKPMLSYHSNPKRWNLDDEYPCLQSVARGQEFVFDTKDYPDAKNWVMDLIDRNRHEK